MATLLLALATCTAWVSILAQQPADQKPAVESDDPTRIKVDVTRVNVLFTVTDKKGRFITNLVKDDFEITENKKPQVIQEFTAETDLSLASAF
jgi:Ca-activated chloride channel homolog